MLRNPRSSNMDSKEKTHPSSAPSSPCERKHKLDMQTRSADLSRMKEKSNLAKTKTKYAFGNTKLKSDEVEKASEEKRKKTLPGTTNV